MARPLRIEYEGAFYHITARGNDRKRIYLTKSDYEQFKDYLKKAQEKYGCLLHCYVLMSNHYHLIVETPRANLSRIMHYINGSYTTYFNVKRRRSGHLFQGRYKAIVVDHDTYLLDLSRYVHLNPVRAEIVKLPEEYPYSSYRSYISQDKEEIVYRDLIWGMTSQDKRKAAKRYKIFVEDAIGAELDGPLKNLYGGMILGGKGFITDILNRLKEHDLKRKEVSYRRALKASNGISQIINVMCSHFGLRRHAILNGKGKYRNMAIYLSKRHTGLTNRQIGELFGNISYSGVTRVGQRFAERMAKDPKLRKSMEDISKNLSNVKG